LLGDAHARGVRHGLFCFSALGLVSRRLACPLLGRQGRRRRRSGGCGVRLAGRLMRGLVVRAGVVMIGGVPVSLSRLVVVLGGPGVMLRVRMMMMLACQFALLGLKSLIFRQSWRVGNFAGDELSALRTGHVRIDEGPAGALEVDRPRTGEAQRRDAAVGCG
jgi:hypothetical protein